MKKSYSYPRSIAKPDHEGKYERSAKLMGIIFVTAGFLANVIMAIATFLFNLNIINPMLWKAIRLSFLANVLPVFVMILIWPSLKAVYRNERTRKTGVGQMGLFLRLLWSACSWVTITIPTIIFILFLKMFL